jgi:predicted Zn-dependent protease
MAALVVVVLVFRSCIDWSTGLIVRRLPPTADQTVGKAAADEFRKSKSGGKPTPEQVARVERIFNEIRDHLDKSEKAILLDPSVTVIVDGQVNAFALPGGQVFVLTGLLDRVGEDDDMLRGVMAHEIGHAVHRHGMRSVVRSAIYAILLAVMLGGADDITKIVVSNASDLDRLSHSREMETDADLFAVDVLRRAGRSPDGLAKFLESLDKQPVPQLLSTHPDSAERARKIREKAKELGK